MIKTFLKDKVVKNTVWIAPVSVMMVSGGQATAGTLLLDGFDSSQAATNVVSSVSASSLNDPTVAGFMMNGQRELVTFGSGSPSVSLQSDDALPGKLTFSSGNPETAMGSALVRWDGRQDNLTAGSIALDFDLDDGIGPAGFDATVMGMNMGFVWKAFNLDLADDATMPVSLTMKVYSGADADDFVSELTLELDNDTAADLMVFNFADFVLSGSATNLADFTTLTAIEFLITAPGGTDVSLDLLESGNPGGLPTGPQNVPEPGTVMALAALGLTGLLAKRKKVS